MVAHEHDFSGAADFCLGKSESEAIALFLQEEADLLLVDDRKGRGVSKALEISWATVPDISPKA